MAEIEVEPETEGDFPFSLLIDSHGKFEFQYDFSVFALDSGELVQLVPVALVDDKVLLAAPFSSWHRKTAKRVLPVNFLQKPTPVEVVSVSEDDMDTPLATLMKVWMGFLNPEFIPSLVPYKEEEEEGPLAHLFGAGDSEGCLPYAQSLFDAAQDHFSFVSAEESARVDAGGRGSGLADPDVNARLDRMEESIVRMSEVVAKLAPAGKAEPRVTFARPPALKKNALKKDAERYPMLDPAVVVAAVNAGMEDEVLQEMQRLVGKGAGPTKKLMEPTPKRVPSKSPMVDILSETEEEPIEGRDDSGAAPGAESSELGQALKQLTEIVTHLTSDKMKRAKSSKVESALEGISASTLTESSTLGSGKKAAAARRILMTALAESPEEVYGLIERLMLEDLTNQTTTPGQPRHHKLCARAWIEHRSRIGSYKTAAFCAWSAGGILDAILEGNIGQARARTCLLILMLDQTAVDRGSWTLSSELSLEQPPPMSSLAQHHPPSVGEGEAPFSRLLDGRWAEVALSHLKETEDYVARRGKLNRKGGDDKEESAKAKAKAKAKGSAASSSQGE